MGERKGADHITLKSPFPSIACGFLPSHDNHRLFLRALGLDDAGSLAEVMNHKEISDSMLPRGSFHLPFMESDAAGFIEVANNAALSGTMCVFAVCLNESNKQIGLCIAWDIDAALGSCRIGYLISKEMWGRGYGKEAVSLLLGFVFMELGVAKVLASVLPTNKRSIGILQALNFAVENKQASGADDSGPLTFSLSK